MDRALEILIVRHSRPSFAFNFEDRFSCPSTYIMQPVNFSTVLFSDRDVDLDPAKYDGVLVFGGAMYVHETHKHPWLVREMNFIERTLKSGVPIVGFCLGGQLLAHVLGAKVYKLTEPEFGYHSITLTKEGLVSPLFKGFPESFIGFEWHYEGFDLPDNAKLLAQSHYWSHQAFSWGSKAFGLQVHLEFSYEHLLSMFEKDREGIPQGFASTNSIDETAQDKASAAAIHASMQQFVTNFAEFASQRKKMAGESKYSFRIGQNEAYQKEFPVRVQ